ncbi:MAG: hypothetical protein RSC36_02005, partial [Ruthenibacterium sp.]
MLKITKPPCKMLGLALSYSHSHPETFPASFPIPVPNLTAFASKRKNQGGAHIDHQGYRAGIR